MIDVFRVHTVVLKKNESSPGLQSDKQLGWKNAVLDLSWILFIKSELHCRRFEPLRNSEILPEQSSFQAPKFLKEKMTFDFVSSLQMSSLS